MREWVSQIWTNITPKLPRLCSILSWLKFFISIHTESIYFSADEYNMPFYLLFDGLVVYLLTIIWCIVLLYFYVSMCLVILFVCDEVWSCGRWTGCVILYMSIALSSCVRGSANYGHSNNKCVVSAGELPLQVKVGWSL